MKKVKERLSAIRQWIYDQPIIGIALIVVILVTGGWIILKGGSAYSNASILRMIEIHAERHGNKYKDCESCSFAFVVRPAVIPIEDTYDSPKE